MGISAVAAAVGWGAAELASGYIAAEILAGSVIGAAAEAIGASVIAGGVGLLTNGIVKSALTGSPASGPAPSMMAASTSRGLLLNEASTVEPIPVIYGSRRVGGARVFLQTSA